MTTRIAASLAMAACLAADALAQPLDDRESTPAFVWPTTRITPDEFRSVIMEEPALQIAPLRFGTTPNGKRQFLGEFGAEYATMVLRELPRHAYVVIRFDLFVIGSWDGSNSTWGPDRWRMGVIGGPELIHTTFNNITALQAYPDNFPMGRHRSGTGESNEASLGFWPATGLGQGARVYPIRVVVPHTQDKIAIAWSGEFNDLRDVDLNLPNNSWAISGLEVDLLTDEPDLSEERLEALWDRLGRDDPIAANAALWELVAASRSAAPFIGTKLGLDAQSDVASEPSRPPARTSALNRSRVGRARRVLQVIGSDEARGLLWRMDRPGGPLNATAFNADDYLMHD